MLIKLSDITNIYLGHPIREKIENTPNGDYLIVQNKDVDKEVGVNRESLYRVNISGRAVPRLLKKDDLLFVPRVFRGSLPYSVRVNFDLPNMIAAPTFTIISVNPNAVRSEYLNWFINSEAHGGKYFKINAMGSSILNIPKSVLREMEITLPSLEEQDRLIQLIKAVNREKEIMKKLIEKRRIFLDEALVKSIK